MTYTTTTKFNVDDIVTIARDYKEFANLDIAQPQIQVYSVMSVNADGTITLAGVFSDIPANYVIGVPIESELAKQIYYDTNHVRPYEIGKCICKRTFILDRILRQRWKKDYTTLQYGKRCKQKNSTTSMSCSTGL